METLAPGHDDAPPPRAARPEPLITHPNVALGLRYDWFVTNTPPATIHLGDCIEVMRTLPENSVDAIVTDPPYGLGFMGKAWDELPPGEEWARECLRVLKPGGHLLAFGGSRTWHRLAVAVEDAGFEVRDSIAWLYGSGFPKSLDVSKAIDKRGGAVADFAEFRDACRAAMATLGVRTKDLQAALGNHMLSHYLSRGSQPAVPNAADYRIIRNTLRLGSRFDALFNDEAEREIIGQSAHRSGIGNASAGHYTVGGTVAEHVDITAPATPAAQQWQGWGTALKPAFEPIVVARKPLTGGTVAANVLAHGTGALNIDGCRVEGDVPNTQGGITSGGIMSGSTGDRRSPFVPNTAGRWPANVVLDESQAAALDQMSGYSKSPTSTGRGASAKASSMSGTLGAQGRVPAPGDSGGASRFFYVAKAPTRERPKVDGIAHPTVKPLALMRWLVRLVTPPGGTVLEPFAGSGTTVEACALEGFACIAIEREPDYLPLIQARLARVEAAQPEPAGPSLFDMEETA